MVLHPILMGMALMTAVAWLFFRTAPHRVDRWFRRFQLLSAALYSLGHGGNDAQKTMGIIAMLLFAAGMSGPAFNVPFWVVLACQAAMALGTLFGGWRIVKTMGMKITKLKPVGGFCAETGGAITLFMATGLGIPVSTTHTITGAIIGVGATNKLSAVRWGVAERIIWAWVLTIPCAAVISALAWWPPTGCCEAREGAAEPRLVALAFFVLRVVARMRAIGIARTAASLSFTTLLALVPLATVAFGVTRFPVFQQWLTRSSGSAEAHAADHRPDGDPSVHHEFAENAVARPACRSRSSRSPRSSPRRRSSARSTRSGIDRARPLGRRLAVYALASPSGRCWSARACRSPRG
jgi:hypothetical protein